MYKLRLLDSPRVEAIHELPVVYEGTLQGCMDYAASNNYKWKPDRNNLFGGYYADPNGNVLYVT